MGMEISLRVVKVGDDHWVGQMNHIGLNFENKVETKPVSKKKAWQILRGFAEEQLGLVKSGRPKGGRRFGHRGRRKEIVDFVVQQGTLTHEELKIWSVPRLFANADNLSRYIRRLVEDGVLKEWTDGQDIHVTIHPDHRHVLGNAWVECKSDGDGVSGREKGQGGLVEAERQLDLFSHEGNPD